jgi:acyl carrier protein
MLDKSYGIKLTDPQKGKAVFASIKALAAYITEHRIN